MRTIAILLVLVLPSVTLAAPRTFAELANLITNLINGGIGVALILGIVVYFYGIVSNMSETSHGKFEKMRTHILWGMIALFVMFSVWGILGLIRNTLFGGTGSGLETGGRNEVFCDSIECYPAN